jgi:hypothetical protein
MQLFSRCSRVRVYVAGEALALKPTDLASNCRVLHITRSIWHGREQEPKTPSAVREVDLPEPLAVLLRGYAANKSGHLFATASGKPLGQRNVLRALHATGKTVGFTRSAVSAQRRCGVRVYRKIQRSSG